MRIWPIDVDYSRCVEFQQPHQMTDSRLLVTHFPGFLSRSCTPDAHSLWAATTQLWTKLVSTVQYLEFHKEKHLLP